MTLRIFKAVLIVLFIVFTIAFNYILLQEIIVNRSIIIEQQKDLDTLYLLYDGKTRSV